jgi:hypothetical protein
VVRVILHYEPTNKGPNYSQPLAPCRFGQSLATSAALISVNSVGSVVQIDRLNVICFVRGANNDSRQLVQRR